MSSRALSLTATDQSPADAFMAFADAVLAAASASADRETALAAAQRELAASLAEPTAFSSLVHNADLTLTEAELLALALACELDVVRSARVAELQGNAKLDRLTVGMVARLLGGIGRCAEAIGQASGLRRAALVSVIHDGPWASAEIAVAPAVVWAIAGDGAPDPDLPPGTTHVESEDPSGLPLVVVTGPDRLRRRQLAVDRCAGIRFLVSPCPNDDAGWAALVREATLVGCGVVIELAGELPAEGRAWVTKAHHIPWALTSQVDLVLSTMPDRAWREFEAGHERPTDEEWRDAFGDGVSRSHQLTAEQMDAVSRAYPAVGGDLDAAVRRLLAGPLANLARRVRPRRTWEDIVLSPDRLGQLHRIVTRYRNAGTVYDEWGLPETSGRGIVALFSGSSGTGKTLAAEIVAGALELDMFKLDLSSVVSKYIGETEKNLEQVFSAASAGNVVLFFDEADSLFGKRSEVKDARDRYANLEVSYLLQRLEAYDGVVVMATNFQKNIDEAFLRRIHVLVDFPNPGTVERREIWLRHLGASAPTSTLDVDWLAEGFEVAGGMIRNAVIDAAFQASADRTPITMHHLANGLVNEQRKAGRLIRLEDYAPYFAPTDA